jgi:hypothetical protein
VPRNKTHQGGSRPQAVGSLADGTLYYAQPGVVPYDPDTDRVQCHLCGRWMRQLPGPHIALAHGMTSDEYRAMFGLGNHGLARPATLDRRSELLKEKIAEDPIWQAYVATGRAMFASGEVARRAMVARAAVSGDAPITQGSPTEIYEQAVATRAGITDLVSHVHTTVAEGGTYEQLASKLGTTPQWVSAVAQRHGVARPHRYRASDGVLQKAADEMGVADAEAYLRAKRAAGSSAAGIGRETGLTHKTVLAAMRRLGVE